MITVVTLNEFRSLLRNKSLSRSENIGFIVNEELRSIIRRLVIPTVDRGTSKYSQESQGGFIAVLHGVVNGLDAKDLQITSNVVTMKLPRPEQPVYLELSDDLPAIKIDTEELMYAVNFDLGDAQLREIVESMFSVDKDSSDSYNYAFLDRINLSSVTRVLYGPELEEAVMQISKEARYVDTVFTRTEVFTQK